MREALVDDLAAEYRHVVRNEEAVHGQCKRRARLVGAVGVAAGGDGRVRVERRDEGDSLRQQLCGEWLCPRVVLAGDAEHLGGVAQQIHVEVSARDGVVARGGLTGHVGKQHVELLGDDAAVGRVGRQVQVVQAQLAAIRRGDPGDRIAAVEVEELHDARLDGQAAAQRGVDPEAAERHLSRPRCAVRLGQRVEQIGGIVVLREHRVALRKRFGHERGFVDVVAARGVDVDLLQEREVGVEPGQRVQHRADVFAHGLGRIRARFDSAVHEERIVRAVRAEAEVPRDDGDRLADGGGLFGRASNLEGQVVFEAGVGGEQVGDVAAGDYDSQRDNCEQRDACPLEHFLLHAYSSVQGPLRRAA